MHRAFVIVVMATVLVGCSNDDASEAVPQTAAPATTATAVGSTTGGNTVADVAEPALRRELLAMMAEDQAEQTGEVATNNYEDRTARLAEILDRYGWPTFDLVGEDGSTAAWVIAQHADLDLELQQRALDLLRAAAEDGQASRGDLAYLADRVAVATGTDQEFGTQMRCNAEQAPEPATPIADEATVDERRRAAGLDPLQDYLDEMRDVCAA